MAHDTRSDKSELFFFRIIDVLTFQESDIGEQKSDREDDAKQMVLNFPKIFLITCISCVALITNEELQVYEPFRYTALVVELFFIPNL